MVQKSSSQPSRASGKNKKVGDKLKATRKAKSGKDNKSKTPVKNIIKTKVKDNIVPEYSNISETIGPREAAKWDRVQAQLKTKLGNDVYQSWFGRCRLESMSKSEILLSVPTVFLKSWIKSHYSDLLLQIWKKQLKGLLRIDVVVRSAVKTIDNSQDDPEINVESASASVKRNTNISVGNSPISAPVGFGQSANLRAKSEAEKRQNPWSSKGKDKGGMMFTGEASGSFRGSPLDPNYTFANLVEGESNRMAVAAAKSVAEADGAVPRFNPLFIYAGVGLGKTHLLQAIAWAATARKDDMKILYLTAEYFMWRFASAIRDQSALLLKESWREIDLLLIDDMQFLQGKSIQQEFCHLLNALIDNAKQVVVAADRQPPELESLDTRVKSRLKGGATLEVKSPEFEMRQKILELRYGQAQREESGLNIGQEVLDYVATKVDSSCRDLEGAFNQLLIQHRFCEGDVQMEVIEKMLGHLVQSSEQKRVRIEDIQKIVARHFNVSKNDLLSTRRTRVIVHPRQVSMYLAKQLTPRSLPEIGRRFGGRDHTTVLHAVRKIEGLLANDSKMTQEIELLKRLIYDEHGL